MAMRSRRTSRVSARPEPKALPPRPIDLDPVRIDGVPLRTPVTLEAVVDQLEVMPRAGSPWLEVTVDDGTGRVVVVFTGRRGLGGVSPGRRLRLHGVVRRERSRLVMQNPAYRLLPE